MVKTKTALDSATLNAANQTPYLDLDSETDKDSNALKLKGKAVVIIDPVTGKALGASDFFQIPTLKVLDFTQPLAVQNTWYPAFNEENVQFVLLGMGITVADETVSIRITIDGELYDNASATNLLFATNMCFSVIGLRTAGLTARFLMTGTPTTSVWVSGSAEASSAIAGRSVKIEVRKTTAGGASALRVMGYYRQWE